MLFSFFHISLETANRFYSLGWKASLFGSFVTLIGVSLLMWGTRVRDHDFESNISRLHTDAAQANERAAQLENDAANARKKTALLEVEAEKTKEAVARANEQTAKLKAEAEETSLQLEKEKSKRFELEQAVSPRIMEQYKSSKALTALTGVTAIITNVPDIESQRMAGQLAATLNMAGWKIQFSPYTPADVYPDGVIIESNVGAILEDELGPKAAELLLSQLRANKIESRTMPACGLPSNTIVVKVGFKPYTFFSDKMNPDENIRVHGNMILPPR